MLETIRYEDENNDFYEKKGFEIKAMINKDNIERISEEKGTSTDFIYQKGEEFVAEYNHIISKEVGLFLYLSKLKKSAPPCRKIKIKGIRCQNKVRPPFIHCYHHRQYYS